jgi:hypothetical protein
MKSDVQALENKVKSMTEIINVLIDKLKYGVTIKEMDTQRYVVSKPFCVVDAQFV